MVFLAIVFILGFAICAVLYGNALRSIRNYLKEYHPELFKKNSLDAVSLFMGTDDVEWNFEKFVHKKQFLTLGDKQLNELSNRARHCGLLTFCCGICMLITVALNGLLGG